MQNSGWKTWEATTQKKPEAKKAGAKVGGKIKKWNQSPTTQGPKWTTFTAAGTWSWSEELVNIHNLQYSPEKLCIRKYLEAKPRIKKEKFLATVTKPVGGDNV